MCQQKTLFKKLLDPIFSKIGLSIVPIRLNDSGLMSYEIRKNKKNCSCKK